MKTKYKMMQLSEVSDDFGNNYPDLATFQIGHFVTTIKPMEYQLNQSDVERFYQVSDDFYGAFYFYDDILLWLNDVDWISDDEIWFNKKIKIYSKTDIDNWYFSGVRGETLITDDRVVL